MTILALCSMPALAAPALPDPAVDLLSAIFAPASVPDQDTPSAPAHLPDTGIPTPQNRAIICSANCWDGSNVSCQGNTCHFVNSNCAAGERGYCDGTLTGTRSCPPCPTPCTARATCSPSGSVKCTSYLNNCFAVDKRYAECDGILHFCTQHGTCPI